MPSGSVLRTLEEFRKIFYNKYPDSELEILELYERDFCIVKDKYGTCKVNKGNLIKGCKPSIETATNKEEYLTNQIKEFFPKNLEQYSILKYKKQNEVIVQNKYGICSPFAGDLLKGHLPYIVSALNKTDYFINQAQEVHKSIYTYENTTYSSYNVKLTVTCKYHNDFLITPHALLDGGGCAKCAHIKNGVMHSENPTGWNKTNWYNSALRSKRFSGFKVYLIECWNENEHFFKIGRTFVEIKNRFSGINLPYDYKILETFEFKELTKENCDRCFDLEVELKKNNKKYKYVPIKQFCGRKECFSELNNNQNDN